MPKDSKKESIISSNINELKKEQKRISDSINELKKEKMRIEKEIKDISKSKNNFETQLDKKILEAKKADEKTIIAKDKKVEILEELSKLEGKFNVLIKETQEKQKKYNSVKDDFYDQSQNEVARMNKILDELNKKIEKKNNGLEILYRDSRLLEKTIKNNRNKVAFQEDKVDELKIRKTILEEDIEKSSDLLVTKRSDINKEKKLLKNVQKKRFDIEIVIRKLIDDKSKVEKELKDIIKATEVAQTKLEITIKKEVIVFDKIDYVKRMEIYVKEKYKKVGLEYQPFRG